MQTAAVVCTGSFGAMGCFLLMVCIKKYVHQRLKLQYVQHQSRFRVPMGTSLQSGRSHSSPFRHHALLFRRSRIPNINQGYPLSSVWQCTPPVLLRGAWANTCSVAEVHAHGGSDCQLGQQSVIGCRGKVPCTFSSGNKLPLL